MPFKDLEKREKYQKEYRIKNKEKSKKYYFDNKDKIRKQQKEYHTKYYKEKKDIILVKQKKYNKEKKESRKIYLKKYYKKRYYNDIEYRLLLSLRSRIRDALKKYKKSNFTKKLVGCSLEELKIYLEKQFKEGMSWENYGKWHIDHIIPCSSFNLINEEEQKQCFHYTNLQPLWAIDNIKKGNRYED